MCLCWIRKIWTVKTLYIYCITDENIILYFLSETLVLAFSQNTFLQILNWGEAMQLYLSEFAVIIFFFIKWNSITKYIFWLDFGCRKRKGVFNPFNEVCYKFIRNKASYSGSRKNCRATGGELAAITTMEEWRFLTKFKILWEIFFFIHKKFLMFDSYFFL